MRTSGEGPRKWAIGCCHPVLFVGFALLCAAAAPVSSQTIWSDGASGDWFTPGNWTLGVPNPANGNSFDARIDNGGSARILAPGAAVRRITLGGLTGQSGGINVGAGGTLNVTENLHLGESGSGVVNVISGGDVTAQFTRLGRFAGGVGSAMVTDTGSTWTTSADFLVGESGAGSLTIQKDADVTVGGSLLLADAAGAPASTLAIGGAGTTLTVSTGLLRIGNAGNATMTLDTAAAVMSQDVMIAAATGSVSSATVAGAGTTWTMAKLSRVGGAGSGTLTINAGAVVNETDTTNASGFILGDAIGGSGTVTITGAGSALNSARDVIVGRVGSGTLSLMGAGTLSIDGGTRPLQLASTAGSSGTLNIGNGALLKASAVQFGAGTGAVNFNQTDVLNFGVPIAGAGTVRKMNTGTISLIAPSTFTGSLVVQSGVLELRGAGDLSASLPVAISSGATFQLRDATTTRSEKINNDGGSLKFFDTTLAGSASITNTPTGASVYLLGSTIFDNTSSADSATITNQGALVAGTFGAETLFQGNATAGTATITNSGGIPSPKDDVVGNTAFAGSATAGAAHITNNAATSAAGGGGLTLFTGQSTAGAAFITSKGATIAGTLAAGRVDFAGKSAGTATFSNQGATAAGAPGGTVIFEAGTGESAAFNNLAGTVAGASGGDLQFIPPAGGAATAGGATIDNFGATVAGAKGGTTRFLAFSSAGTATIHARGAAASGAGTTGGAVTFTQTADAANAAFDIRGGTLANAPGGTVDFFQASTGGASATYSIDGASNADFLGGVVTFHDSATAGTATFTAHGGGPNPTVPLGTPGGLVAFANNASADSATFNLEGATASGGAGGLLRFRDTASAGKATINALITSIAGTTVIGGAVEFDGASTAGNATIVTQGVKTAGIYFLANGTASFYDKATAGAATIENQTAEASGAGAGNTQFHGTSNAGTAMIRNRAPGANVVASSAIGGETFFYDTSSAQGATLINEGGSSPHAIGGATFFYGNSTASNATLILGGAQVDSDGRGAVFFNDTTSAGNATIYVDPGPAAGGSLTFASGSDGGTSRVVLGGTGASAGGFDISQLTTAGMNIGSIEGQGIVSLGARTLTVGGNNLDTIYSGLIRDGGFIPSAGGKLAKAGLGTLTLNTPNTYTGGTTVNNGTLNITETTGQAIGIGPATVNSGGVLQFSGKALAGANTVTVTPSASVQFQGGRIIFHDFASAGSLSVLQAGTTFAAVSTESETDFLDDSTAANASFTSAGGQAGDTAHGGAILFSARSTAGSAIITSQGGAVAGAAGAFVTLDQTASAGAAHFVNGGTGTIDSRGLTNGGFVQFLKQSNAATASFINNGGTASGGSGGNTRFSDTASAGSATFTNLPGVVAGAPGGFTRFLDSSSAGNSHIEGRDATVPGALGGYAQFEGSSTAANATLIAMGASAEDRNSGEIHFIEQSTAGNASIIAKGGGASAFAEVTPGGLINFANSSTAGAATFTVESGAGGGGHGGEVKFRDAASAGHATFNLLAPTISAGGGNLQFYGTSTAGNATITGEGAKNVNAYFNAVANVIFREQSTAGSATITNLPATAAQSNGSFIGFTDNASAGAAMLRNRGSALAGIYGGDIAFFGNSTAGTSTIIVEGGSVPGALGSDVRFDNNATAGDANITVGGGIDAGAGSNVRFSGNSTGGLAAFTIETNALFNLTQLTAAGITTGSIAGGGSFNLGAKSLTTGGLNTSTTVSGAISGAGGSLTKVGTGTLTLTGANSFTGAIAGNSGAIVLTQSPAPLASLSAANNGVVKLALSGDHSRLLKANALFVSDAGRIDLTDNKLITSSPLGIWTGTRYTGVMGLLQSGYNNGAWNGPGVMTSAISSSTALGVALADDIGYVGKTFAGATVNTGDVLVAYTLAGDANLDSKVDFNDLVRLAQNYNTTGGKLWSQGNFNYDASVDFNDLVKLAQNYNTALPSAIPGAPADFNADLTAAVAQVPEPGSLSLITIAVLLFARRRRPVERRTERRSRFAVSHPSSARRIYFAAIRRATSSRTFAILIFPSIPAAAFGSAPTTGSSA